MIDRSVGTNQYGSTVLAHYSEGVYFADPSRHSGDARFKAEGFLRVFLEFARDNDVTVRSLVDVGCGSGDAVKMLADSLRERGFDLAEAKGYDISPHVRQLERSGVEYVHGDFCE